jgi:hypothetical protein
MLDPSIQFCHNPGCPARGKVGEGNIGVHSQKDRRFRCRVCGKSFAAAKGTPFHRLHKAADLIVFVLTLLCHGCPIQAMVAAFGLDEPHGGRLASLRGPALPASPRAYRPATEGGAASRPGRRTVGQDGGKTSLDGDGHGGACSTVAGRGDQRPQGQGVDHQPGEGSPCLRQQSGHVGVRGRLVQLWWWSGRGLKHTD